MTLWRCCFDDPEPFVRLYFDTRYREEDVQVRREEGRVVSALQLLPYTLTCWGGEIPAAYIYGACTHPRYRCRGGMQTLLSEALREISRRRIPVSVLIPAREQLYDYYRRLGYAPVVRRTEAVYTGVSPTDSFVREYNIGELYTFFSSRMRERPCCIQHSLPDFRFLVEDIRLSGGWVIAVAGSSGRPGGLAFALPQEDNRVVLKECLYECEVTRCRLLGAVSALFPDKEIHAFSPVTRAAQPSEAAGMLRITDAAACLQRYAAAHPDVSFSYHIEDPVVSANNALFVAERGICRQLPPDPEVEKTDIAALPGLLWPSGPKNFAPFPYMSLMMD